MMACEGRNGRLKMAFTTNDMTAQEVANLKRLRAELFADHGADAHDLMEVAAESYGDLPGDPWGSTMGILFDLAEALWRYGCYDEMAGRDFKPGLSIEDEDPNQFDDLLADGCDPAAALDFFDYIDAGREVLVAHGQDY
jgi:hypothetical protein